MIETQGVRLSQLDELLGDGLDGPRSLRQVFLRPAIEPILLSRWSSFQKGLGLGAGWIELGRTLTPMIPVRTGPIVTTPSGNGSYTKFPEHEEISGWDNELDVVLMSNMPPLSKAFALHALVSINHPFSDGNGRLSRAAFWVSAAAIGLRAPVLPWAAIQYQNPDWISSAHRRLSMTSDWAEFFEYMGQFEMVFEAVIAQLRLTTCISDQR